MERIKNVLGNETAGRVLMKPWRSWSKALFWLHTHGMSAVPNLTLLSADALSEFRVHFISPVSAISQTNRETKCPPER